MITPYPRCALAAVALLTTLCGCELSFDAPDVEPWEESDGGDADADFDADNDDGGDADADLDAETLPRVPFGVAGGAIRDETGEALLLRGLNVSQVSKDIEGHLYPLTADDVSLILRRGFNSVRLLTFWEAVMPEGPGLIDEGYVEGFADQVGLFAEGGVAVVVDMHQDLWGRPFGDGAPEWACPEEIREGYVPVEPWWHNYMSPQVNGCFDTFWADPDLQSDLIDAWVAVAAAVCDRGEVVGFDPMNEPWPGSELGSPGFDNETLMGFYTQVMDAVESVCPGRVFFLEPTLAYELGLTDALEIPASVRDRVVLAPHFYPTMVHEPGAGYDGDADALEQTLLYSYGAFIEQGTPLWIGEYGGITTNPNFDLYFDDVSTIFSSHFIGSALWEYSEGATSFSFLSQDGEPRDAFASAARVPVPSVLPDCPLSVDVDAAAGELAVTFTCSPDRRVSLLLPEEGPDTCSITPDDAIETDEPLPWTFSGRCAADDQVTITCP